MDEAVPWRETSGGGLAVAADGGNLLPRALLLYTEGGGWQLAILPWLPLVEALLPEDMLRKSGHQKNTSPVQTGAARSQDIADRGYSIRIRSSLLP